MALNLMELKVPEKLKRPLKWIGYPVFAIAVFNLSLYMTLPIPRIQERVEGVVGEWLNADVASRSFTPTIFSGVGFRAEGVTVKSRPMTAAEKPVIYTVESVTLHPVLGDLLRGFTSVMFRGDLLGGRVEGGRFRSVPEEGLIGFEAKDLSLAAVPNLGAMLGVPGVPIAGILGAVADLRAQKNLLADSYGLISLTIDNLVVGDGKAKLTVAGNPYLASGLTLPRIKFGSLKGTVSVEKGRATLQDVKAHSSDLDLEVQGYVELRDPPTLTVLHLYLLLKPSDALLKREASLEAIVSMGGGLAKRTDGYYGISLTGPVASPLALPAKEAPLGLKSTAPSAPRVAPSPRPAPVAAPTPAPRVIVPTAVPVAPTELHPPPNDSPPPAPSIAAPPPSMAVPPPSMAAPPSAGAAATVGEPPSPNLPPPSRFNSAMRSIGVLPAPSAPDTEQQAVQ